MYTILEATQTSYWYHDFSMGSKMFSCFYSQNELKIILSKGKRYPRDLLNFFGGSFGNNLFSILEFSS